MIQIIVTVLDDDDDDEEDTADDYYDIISTKIMCMCVCVLLKVCMNVVSCIAQK